MILAIGNSSASEVEAFNMVVVVLKKRGHDVLLFKQDKCLENESLLFETEQELFKHSVIIDGNEHNIEKFSAIWYMHPTPPRELLSYQPVEHRQLIHRQFQAMRESLWMNFRHLKWINDPMAVQTMENKIYQLKMAKESSLSIPSTLITSNPDRVRAFYRRYSGNIITKLLAVSPILNKVVYTNRVLPEHMDKIESVKMSPAIFQELVPKAYELRITIVGDKIFSARINSQDDKETSLDWRRKPKLNDFTVKIETTSIPKEIEDRLFVFMKKAGLRFGCIDVIVTPEGNYIFLEINPNGQWHFIQLKTGAQIAEGIAELLIQKRR